MNVTRPIVSAVMPVYKTPEDFLRNSIESVLTQTIENIELILVDDGSPDNCGEICEEYAQRDKRVIVLHQENQGPSVARNNGLRHVRGEFFTFVDSDDGLKSDAWEKTLKVFENSQIDCAVFGWVDITQEGSAAVHNVSNEYCEISSAEAMFQIGSDNYSCGGGYPWNKMWRTDRICLEYGKIPEFREGIYTYEDKLWILEVLPKLNKIALMPDVLYEYRFLSTSLTQDANAWAKRQFNAYEAYDRICEVLKPVDRRAYEGAARFYFNFCHKDMTIIRGDRWRDEERYQRTRRQLMSLCHRIHLGELHGIKCTILWLWYWLLGLFMSVERRAYQPEPAYMNAKGPHGRVLYFDFLRILAAFCVVWEHFGNEIHWYDGSMAWKMCVPIHTFTFWAVPVFFMLTGATCLTYRKKHSTLGFFKQRVKKTVFPYVVWSTIALIIGIVSGSLQLMPGIKNSVVQIGNLYLTGSAETTYWFFIPLFAIYMAMPVMSLMTQDLNRSYLRYTLVIGILTVSLLPFFYNLISVIACPEMNYYWNGYWSLPVVGGFAIYALLGYWAATHEFSKLERLLCYLGGIGCLFIRIVGIYQLSPELGTVPGVLMDYLYYPTLGLALAVFVAAKYMPFERLARNDKISKIIVELSECSFGVYLTHIFILKWMEIQPFFAKYSAFWYFGCPVICYVFTLLIVYCARKIPLLRKIF
ncbi:MAG: glycosyltransferase [Clostridia bacterium]|nr:glycosyltransferase [Clostridia bacterium]